MVTDPALHCHRDMPDGNRIYHLGCSHVVDDPWPPHHEDHQAATTDTICGVTIPSGTGDPPHPLCLRQPGHLGGHDATPPDGKARALIHLAADLGLPLTKQQRITLLGLIRHG